MIETSRNITISRKYSLLISISLFVTSMGLSLKNYPPLNWTPYDGALYIDIAHSLSHNITDFSYQGIYMMFRPPIYPYTLSLFYRLFPPKFSIEIARIVSSSFYAGTSVLIFLLFKKLLGDLKALGASVFYILNPISLGMSTQPLVHSEFTFFYLISIYWLLKWSITNKIKEVILFGFFTGVSILTRYTGLTIILISLAYIYILLFANRINLDKTLKHLVIGILVILLTILPWMILGYRHYSGLISPFIVASKEVNTAVKVSSMEYTKEIIHTLGVPTIILIVLGFAYSMVQRDNFHALLLSWMTIGFMGILTITHKEIRFITFLTPAIAILSVEGSCVILRALEMGTTIIKAKHEMKFIVLVIVLLFLYINSYSNAIKYADKYYYAGATQDKVFVEFKEVSSYNKDKKTTLLVSPNLYPYGGLFLPNAKIYQMSSYRLNWLVHGIKGQPPNISKMITNGDFGYIIYCNTPNLQKWIVQIKYSHKYTLIKEMFKGKCIILKHK